MAVSFKTGPARKPSLSGMKHWKFAAVAALLAVAGLHGEEAGPMSEIAWLEGQWEGEGWILTGPNQREEFRGTETVESRLGGQALVIEGRHAAKEDPTQIVHAAVAVVSYDDARGYRFYAKTGGRPAIDADAAVEDGVFVWRMNAAGAQIRYRIRRTDSGDWHEVGEREVAPGRWFPFFEMNLKRVSD